MEKRKPDWRRALLTIGGTAALVLLVNLAVYIFPAWTGSIGLALLLLASIPYILLRRLETGEAAPVRETDDILHLIRRWYFLRNSYFLLAGGGIFLFVYVLARVSLLHWLKQDHFRASLLIGLFAGMLLPLIPLWFVRRRERELVDEEEPAEVKEARRRAKKGWGMTVEAAHKRALGLIRLGVIIGGLGIMMGILFIFQPGSSSGHPNLLLSLGGGVWLALSVLTIVMMLYEARPFLRIWRTWRGQPQETITLQGRLVGMWWDEKNADWTFIKMQPSSGPARMLVVGGDLENRLPEEEGKDVQITYLSGTEAVIGVEVLADEATSF